MFRFVLIIFVICIAPATWSFLVGVLYSMIVASVHAVAADAVPQERFRTLVESDENLNKWSSVPRVVPELLSKEVKTKPPVAALTCRV